MKGESANRGSEVRAVSSKFKGGATAIFGDPDRRLVIHDSADRARMLTRIEIIKIIKINGRILVMRSSAHTRLKKTDALASSNTIITQRFANRLRDACMIHYVSPSYRIVFNIPLDLFTRGARHRKI